jgi:hypothetical protein
LYLWQCLCISFGNIKQQIMKRIVLVGIVSVFVSLGIQAQTKPAKKSGIKAGSSKTVRAQSSPLNDTASVVLVNTGSNAAFSTRLRITDPTVNTLSNRAAGAPIADGAKPIIGMPRSTYGIANGRILLRNTTATTPGTAYGSGAVGTGTSILGVGTSEATLGVNGKSPYAGPWLWGDRRPAYPVAIRDSTKR